MRGIDADGTTAVGGRGHVPSTTRGQVLKLAPALAAVGALVLGTATPALGAEVQRAGSGAKARHVVALARQSLDENGLKAVILRVDMVAATW